MSKKIFIIIGLVVYLILIYVAAVLLKLSGSTMALFIGLLALVGIIAAILVLWFMSKDPSFSAASDPALTNERTALQTLLNEADHRLAQSPKAGVKQLSALPIIYVLGEANSAKTSIVLNSGLDSDLLSGQIYREKAEVAATQFVNVLFSGPASVMEVGAPVWKQRGLWQTIIRHTLPNRIRAAASSRLPARAVVVCVNCERFLAGASPEELLASARQLNDRLREMSQTMGISLPVYVLFTKLDRVPMFAEYVKNLNQQESTQLLGATLPFLAANAGLYGERASQIIAQNFDELTYSLSEFRYDLLSREQEAAQRAAIYEFTRELRKLKQQLVEYLVELARPSQLSASPYIRGFFFTGVRANVIQESVSAAAVQPSASPLNAGATQFFSARAAQAAQVQQAPSVTSRKVAQWAFLTHLFPNLILQDRSALESSTASKQVNLMRRLALAVVCFLLFAYFVMLIVSYANNQSLAGEIKKAQQNLPTLSSPTTELAAGTDLQQMDHLRSVLVQLQSYRKDGAPMSYRMGLYEGDDLLDAGLQTYFQHFRQLILSQTQTRIITALGQVPDTPAPGADYQATYDPLRAYLTTTSNHDKSTVDFLSPVLQQYYLNQRTLSPENQILLRRQLDFYSTYLKEKNPYTISPDMGVVTHARIYLSKFGGIERIYQNMLAAAGKTNPSIDFNRDFPGSAETVVAPHIVPGAFTKPGFTFMQDAILHPDRYFNGEVWVLGDQAGQSLDYANLTTNLTQRYTTDYLDQWRTFLKTAAVVHYRSLPDAAAKLNTIEGATSPLLALFWTVSRNTAVSWPTIADSFQPTQALVPPSATNQYIGPGNTTYVNALIALQGSISQVAQNPGGATDPAAAGPIISAATTAHSAAQQTSQAFHIDQAAHVEGIVLKLMQDPIASTEALVRGMAPAQANGGGKSFCSGFNHMTAEFPFNSASTTPASPDEVKALLQSGSGALWQFYDSNLKTLIVQQGLQYAPAPNAPVHVTGGFLSFFNHAAGLSHAMFANNAQQPTLTFTIRELPSQGITNATITVDSQQISNPNEAKSFTWTVGSSQSATLTASYLDAKNLPLLQFNGPWAIFQLMNKAKSTWTPSSGHLEFPLEVSGTPIHLTDGTPLVVKFDVTMQQPIVFDHNYLAGMRCVADVASAK